MIFMPTWNQKFQVSRSDFVKTDYFRYINTLLTSGEFISILEKYNFSCIFVSHYLMEQYKDVFSFDAQYVSFYDEKKDGSIANLLKTSSALITDYSSVYYDMLYMKKL
jgi:CDP-glycerol glycerophosphotransferase (TagB/SpsB family)